MAGRGGNQPPANPAPVSGPGALSQRTDGQPIQDMPNADYGENQTFREVQSGAPMAGGGNAAQAGGGQMQDPLASLVGLGSPTQAAGTPITDGASAGPGRGPDALGLPQTRQQERAADVARMSPGMVAAL